MGAQNSGGEVKRASKYEIEVNLKKIKSFIGTVEGRKREELRNSESRLFKGLKTKSEFETDLQIDRYLSVKQQIQCLQLLRANAEILVKNAELLSKCERLPEDLVMHVYNLVACFQLFKFENVSNFKASILRQFGTRGKEVLHEEVIKALDRQYNSKFKFKEVQLLAQKNDLEPEVFGKKYKKGGGFPQVPIHTFKTEPNYPQEFPRGESIGLQPSEKPFLPPNWAEQKPVIPPKWVEKEPRVKKMPVEEDVRYQLAYPPGIPPGIPAGLPAGFPPGYAPSSAVTKQDKQESYPYLLDDDQSFQARLKRLKEI